RRLLGAAAARRDSQTERECQDFLRHEGGSRSRRRRVNQAGFFFFQSSIQRRVTRAAISYESRICSIMYFSILPPMSGTETFTSPLNSRRQRLPPSSGVTL